MAEAEIQESAQASPTAARTDRTRWLFLAALIVLCGVLYFWRLGVTPLEDFDEAYYAEGAREMLGRGDLGTPYFNGQPFLLKPVLIYWIIAAAFRTLGSTEFAARAPSAFLGLAIVLMTYFFAAKVLTRRAAFFAGLALALNYLWIEVARDASIDVPLTAALTPALFLFYLGTRATERKWRYYLPAYPLLGLALLAKGPVPAGVVVTGLLAYLIAARRLGKTLREASLLPGLALLLLVAVPWYAYELHVQPSFFRIFFIGEHFGHIEGRLARTEPVWGNLQYLLIYFFPWVAFLPAALLYAFRRPREDVLRFCAWWLIAVVVLFSIPESKLAHYLAPAFPPLAILAGAWLDRWLAQSASAGGRFAFWLLGIAGFLCAAGAMVAAVYPPAIAARIAAKYGDWTPGASAAVMFASLGVGFLGAMFCARRRRAWVVPLLAAGMLVCGLTFVGFFRPRRALIEAQPRKELALYAARILPSSEPLGVFYAKRNSTIFYLGRPLLDLGEWEPKKLADLLSSPHPAAAITHEKFLPGLREAGVKYEVLERRGEWVLVGNGRREVTRQNGDSRRIAVGTRAGGGSSRAIR